MKIIAVETKYYLLKPHEIQTETSDYYYVKVENELMPDRAVWMQGYVNHMGGVSTVGVPFNKPELVEQLEAELEEALRGEPIPTINYPQTDSQSIDQCMHYDCAQGKNRCCCLTRKSNRCSGVCKDYEQKKI